MAQFLYLPIAFLALSRIGMNFKISEISTIALTLILISCLLSIAQWLLLDEAYRFAPFGTEGDRRYWYLGTSHPRVSALIGNPLTYLEVSMPLLFASFVGFWRVSSTGKLLRLTALGLGLFVYVFLTQSRLSVFVFLALLCVLVVYLAASATHLSIAKILRRMTFGGIFGFMAVLAFLLTTETNTEARMKSALSSLQVVVDGGDINSIGEESAKVRIDMHMSALKAIGERPLLGYGASEIMQAVQPYFQSDVLTNPNRFKTLHSLYLNNLISTGALGLILLLALLCSPLVFAVKYRAERGAEGIEWIYLSAVLLISILVSGVFNNVFYDDLKNTAYLNYMFVVLIGMAQARHSFSYGP